MVKDAHTRKAFPRSRVGRRRLATVSFSQRINGHDLGPDDPIPGPEARAQTISDRLVSLGLLGRHSRYRALAARVEFVAVGGEWLDALSIENVFDAGANGREKIFP